MYHSVANENEEKKHPYFHINTQPSVFATQMAYLRDNNYISISLEEASRYLTDERNDKKRYVVITFDDGYENFLINAFPVLQQFKFSATVFLPTAYIGDQFNGRNCLSWQQVNELIEQNICFGSHTVSHPRLKMLSKEDVTYEIKTSKDIIEQKTGSTITDFSHPYAFPEEDKDYIKFIKMVFRQAGYRHCVTTSIGICREGNGLFFNRLPVNTWDDNIFFEAKLGGSYNWLHPIQFGFKSMKYYMRPFVSKRIKDKK
jgi:peptidoglycan/xylan/chitin deacetylase (PgdA/CDA1 family)